MKLSSINKTAHFTNPDITKLGILIYGPNAVLVAKERKNFVESLIGPDGVNEMRLSHISSSDLRKDPCLLIDSIKAQSFFPGARVTLIEPAGDSDTKFIANGLKAWELGDSQIVVTAGTLKKNSSLRKLFETHKNAFSLPVYDDPPNITEIKDMVAKAGLKEINEEISNALFILAKMIDKGTFEQTIEKLALFKISDQTSLSIDDIEKCMPLSYGSELDDLLDCVAEGRVSDVRPTLGRLSAQGVTPITMCISMIRHFKTLFSIVSDPEGIHSGLSKLRPPLFGSKKEKLRSHANSWGLNKSKFALSTLIRLDIKLRSANKISPALAVVEREMVRLAMYSRQRN